MNETGTGSLVIRPCSSKRGLSLLLIFVLISLFFMALSFFIFHIAPADDSKAHTLIMIMRIISVIIIIPGIILYFVFPRVKIIFDSSRKEAVIKNGMSNRTIIPFSSLEPFQVYHLLRGYAHQYYCRNGSFGEFDDLFFSTFHGKTLKNGKRLAALTGVPLIDYNGEEVL